MTQPHSRSSFWIYLGECLRLLYWSYFKPFTLQRWLRDIHPELSIVTNPFSLRDQFETNPRLHRYANQAWWLILTVPLLAALLIAPIYQLTSGEIFNFFNLSLFYLSWSLGLLLVRFILGKAAQKFIILCYILMSIVFFGSIISGLPSETIAPLLEKFSFFLDILPQSSLVILIRVAFGVGVCVTFGVARGVAFGVGLGVGLGVSVSVAFGVAVGVGFGVALGVARGVTFDVARGVARGVAKGVGFGVGFGVAFGVGFGVGFGVAAGVAYFLGLFRIYFWALQFPWMLGLFILSRGKNAARALYFIPQRFDELIFLPLPFADRLIVEAYRDHPAIARNTLDYLMISTNQQSLAARAILQIAIESLDRCRTVGEIVAISAQLEWITSLPSAQLGERLPEFLNISQSVRAANNATSPYRQVRLLAQPIADLEALRNRLPFQARGSEATTFSAIARRWLNILQEARQILTEQAARSPELPPVYNAGSALDPQQAKGLFKGRQGLFREIENFSLAPQPPTLLLYGGRRTGKTSALKYLPHKVGGDLVPLLVDIQGLADASTLTGLAKSFANSAIEAGKTARNVQLPSPDWQDIERDPFPGLRTWFTQIETRIPNQRFLLCLDEFERLDELIATTGSRAPLNFFRHLMQHRPRWILLFSGAHLPDDLESYWMDYLINTRTLRLTYLRPDEARELLLHPTDDFPQIYQSEAIDYILDLTRAQPFLIQSIGETVVDELNRRAKQTRTDARSMKVTVADIESLIPTAIERSSGYFIELWQNTLTERERRFLTNFIQGRPQGTPLEENHSAIARKLVQKELLEKSETGEYRFQVPLVRQYIEQVVRDR